MVTCHRRLPRENIEAVLGLQLPSRRSAAPEDVAAECSICYAFRLKDAGDLEGEGAIPEVGGRFQALSAVSLQRECVCMDCLQLN